LDVGDKITNQYTSLNEKYHAVQRLKAIQKYCNQQIEKYYARPDAAEGKQFTKIRSVRNF
jgi:hypothetical protein